MATESVLCRPIVFLVGVPRCGAPHSPRFQHFSISAFQRFVFLVPAFCYVSIFHTPSRNNFSVSRPFDTWHSPCLRSENHTRAKNMPASVQQCPWRSADQSTQAYRL